MEYIETEYFSYWETNMFFQHEELSSMYGLGDALSCHYDSSSPEGTVSSIVNDIPSLDSAAVSGTRNKYIIMERNRRKKLNEKLYRLRTIVPTITKMDKASIIKDSINYIEVLQAEEKKLKAEISQLDESMNEMNPTASDESDIDHLMKLTPPKKKKKTMSTSSLPHYASSCMVELVKLKLSAIGEDILTVSITCNKKTGSLAKLCQVLESLSLKIITGSITAMSGSLQHTLFVEAEEMDSVRLKGKIEVAIAEFDMPRSPISSISF